MFGVHEMQSLIGLAALNLSEVELDYVNELGASPAIAGTCPDVGCWFRQMVTAVRSYRAGKANVTVGHLDLDWLTDAEIADAVIATQKVLNTSTDHGRLFDFIRSVVTLVACHAAARLKAHDLTTANTKG